jgi:plastocyanin
VHPSQLPRLAVFVLGLGVSLAPAAQAQPRARPAPATRSDIDRLDKKIEDQQRRLDKLVKLQLQYLQTLAAMTDGSPLPVVAPDARSPEPAEPRQTIVAEPRPRQTAMLDVKPKRPRPEPVGNVVGKVVGADDAIVYIDDIVVTTRGTAIMKQENKGFVPPVLVVPRGTTVQFPNLDAYFHNVFSVTPDNSFDLGSYRQGEAKNVTMSRSGVVNVYCNMHPQMIGHILVVPNGNYVRAGKDGTFRLSNVPAGRHRIVAWAPEAKPVVSEADVSEVEPVSVDFELKKGRSGPHLKKDGLPYGSYDK